MRVCIGRLVAILALATAIPLSALAQEHAKKGGAAAPPARAAPARAAPAARAPAPHAAPAARMAPSRPAPQRAERPHVAPQRSAAPAVNRSAQQPRHQAQPRSATPQRNKQAVTPQRNKQAVKPQRNKQAVTPQQNKQAVAPQRNKQAVTPQANSRQVRRQEQKLRQREDRALRSLPAKQRAAKRDQIQHARKQRAAERQRNAQSKTQTSPSLAATQNTRIRTGLRHNGQARVTPKAARQGRFASRFATARGINAAGVRGSRFAARQAWRHGQRAGFVPWYGPVFWPYAYSDVFNYAFWPGGYDNGYWAYAYDDFFDGVFWGEAGPPQEYVQEYAYAEPSISSVERPSHAAVQALCKQPGNGVTAWPFAEIEKKVGLNVEQKQLLGDVRRAGNEAAVVFKASCPPENAFPLTPPGRLTAITARLDATLGAVQTVKPALETFYSSLSDEQKERFNEIGPKQQTADRSTTGQASADDGKSCKDQKPGLTNLPIERVEDAVKPTDAQEADLKRLDDATAKAVSIMQAACPEDVALTPPGRLEVMETRLKAMIEAANTVKPALDSFYTSLSDEQRARFNRLGGELAKKGG